MAIIRNPTKGAIVSTGAYDQRQEILNREVAAYVSRGYTVESSTPGQAILSKRARIGWFWNTVLTFFTAGLWLIVVIYKLVNRKVDRVILAVTENGNVIRS